MPRYDYRCRLGHVEEQTQGREAATAPCPICGDMARRVILEPPFTITETGSVNGPIDRNRRDHAGEKLEHLRKSSVKTTRETGKVSGPFEVRDWEK